jgi:hypothetical protein
MRRRRDRAGRSSAFGGLRDIGLGVAREVHRLNSDRIDYRHRICCYLLPFNLLFTKLPLNPPSLYGASTEFLLRSLNFNRPSDWARLRLGPHPVSANLSDICRNIGNTGNAGNNRQKPLISKGLS